MKLLGYLFVLALILAAVGYYRGWFTVEAASTESQANVRLTVDRDQVSKDAKSVIGGVGGTAASPAANSTVDGRITAIDAATQVITVEVGSRTSVHRIGATVPITRDGARIEFAQLRPDMLARLSFDDSKPTPNLVGLQLLP